MLDLRKKIDRDVLAELHLFLEKINERNLFTRGLVSKYDPPNTALGEDVEYFSSQITLDDRMVYIMNHIVTSPGVTMVNRVSNTIISHFYGARGIHSVITGDWNPATALVDFERIADEQTAAARTGKVGEYTKALRDQCLKSKKAGYPFWGTTELHTSIMDAGNKFVNGLYGVNDSNQLAVAEWIASWRNNGTMDKLIGSKSLNEMYDNLREVRGIGAYYGYHCATSNSVNPDLPFDHDESFCSPGPGARFTLSRLFPNLSEKEVSIGDRVIWVRENQDELFPGLRDKFHPATYNVVSNGIKIFKDEQNELKVYGTEVGLCQYSVYCRLKENPHLVNKRKVARSGPIECADVESFFQ